MLISRSKVCACLRRRAIPVEANAQFNEWHLMELEEKALHWHAVGMKYAFG